MRGPPVYVDGNDDEPEHALTRKASATGADEPATGLMGLTFRLSATRNGAAIHGTLSKPAAERGTTGLYAAVLEGTDLTAHLNNATYLNKDIYQVFGNGQDVNYSVARRVLAVRP